MVVESLRRLLLEERCDQPARGEKLAREEQASRRFFRELASISSLIEARRFADGGPSQGEPGGEHYTHLGPFLYWVMATGYTVPEDLSPEEKEAFCALLDRSDARGELNVGARDRLKAEMMSA